MYWVWNVIVGEMLWMRCMPMQSSGSINTWWGITRHGLKTTTCTSRTSTAMVCDHLFFGALCNCIVKLNIAFSGGQSDLHWYSEIVSKFLFLHWLSLSKLCDIYPYFRRQSEWSSGDQQKDGESHEWEWLQTGPPPGSTGTTPDSHPEPRPPRHQTR